MEGAWEERSGGFCCPAPPGAAEFPSVARWVQPRYFRVISGREALNYAAMASASLSLALVSFAQFNGLHGPGESIVFQHTSILVRPRQKAPKKGLCGGAAGYCPRVRCAYYTTRFITIAGRTRQHPYGGARPLFQAAACAPSVRPGSTGRRRAWRPAARRPSPAPSTPACAPASGPATPPDRRPSCGTAQTCPPSALLPHGRDA